MISENHMSFLKHAIDKGKYCLGIFLDLSKAFDTIDHDILVKKLENYGIRGVALNCFRNYLSDRRQFVIVRGCKSQATKIQYGVPQGSVLGPLLFILYINDIVNSSKLFSYSLFADDTSLMLSHKDPHLLMSLANEEIKKLYEWFCCNKLLLNAKKSKIVLFRSKGKKVPLNIIPLSINGQVIMHSENVLFLGVVIDEYLTWGCHLKNVCVNISRSVGVLSKLRCVLPKRVLITLYNLTSFIIL